MKGWQRAARGMRLGWFLNSLVALMALVNRGPARSWPVPACPVQQSPFAPTPTPGEPPLAEGSMPPGRAAPPFTPPPPTPLPADETPPSPAMPPLGAEPADPPVSVVRLRVRVPARVQPDKEIEYRLTVENVSRAAAHHVTVRDRLPAGTRFVRAEPKPGQQTPTKGGATDLLWDFGTLKPGEHKSIALAINPAETDEVQNSAYVSFEQGQTVTTRVAKPGVRVRALAPERAVLYDPITFRLEVANSGTISVKDLVLTEELPAGLEFVSGKPTPKPDKPLTWKLAELAPGQTFRVEYQAISKQAGIFHTKTKVTAAGGVREQASATVTVGEAKLSLEKSGPSRRLVNRPTPYQITVSNPGTMPALGVQVSDEIPAGIEFLAASPGGRLASGQVHWSLGTLAPGERRTLQVVVRAPRPGSFGNMVRAKAEHDLSVKALARTQFETAAGPTVEIDKNADPLEIGQKAIYTIRLINPEKTAFLRPSLIVSVPEEMAVLGSRGPTTGQRDGQTIRFGALPALDAGQEVVYTVEVEAKKTGEAKLRVELTDGRATPGPPQVWDDKTTIRQAPRLLPRPSPTALQVSRTKEG